MGISTLVIVNTEARNVRTGLRWARLEADAMRRLAPAELEFIDHAEDAEQTAWDAAMAGYGRLLVVGDLPTTTAFVNGVMRLSEVHRRALKVGFLSLGRPNAWCHALGASTDVERQLDVLCAGNVLPFDVGHVSCVNAKGEPVSRHFISGAALLAPTFRAALNMTVNATLTRDGEVVHQGECHIAFAMQSNYYPGMGLIAPQASPSDGALDVAWVNATGLPGIAQRAMISLLRLPVGLQHATCQEVRLSSRDGSFELQVDGLPMGRLPAVITVVPRTLQVIVESVAARLREKQKAILKEMPGTVLAGHYKRQGNG